MNRQNSSWFFNLLRPAARATLVVVMLVLHARFAQAQSQSGITSPGTGSAISGDVPIIGTAVIDPFQKYELHYKQEPSGNDAFIYFDGSTSPVTNGQLGVWRASGLPPGIYSLRLRVVKNDGNYAEYFAQNLSVNQGPPPTPTSSEPTPTPTSSEPTPTFTPGPTATPNIGQVEQPQVVEKTPVPVATPTPAPIALANPAQGNTQEPATGAGVIVDPGAAVAPAGSVTRSLGEALSLDRLREQFYRGIRYSAALFFMVFAIFFGKYLYGWARRRFG